MHLHRSANALRVSRAYQRRRAGVVVLPIEVDAVALADVLIEARLLDPNLADDRRALATATGKLIEIFCEDKTL